MNKSYLDNIIDPLESVLDLMLFKNIYLHKEKDAYIIEKFSIIINYFLTSTGIIEIKSSINDSIEILEELIEKYDPKNKKSPKNKKLEEIGKILEILDILKKEADKMDDHP